MKRKRGRKGIFDRGFASAKGDVFTFLSFCEKRKEPKKNCQRGN
jgi:hypothetical protein